MVCGRPLRPAAWRLLLYPFNRAPILISVKTAFFEAAPTVCSYGFTRLSCCFSLLISKRQSTCLCGMAVTNLHLRALTIVNPFPVPCRFNKHFNLDVNGKSKEITADRLKPAKLIGDPGIVQFPAAVSAPHSPTLSAPQEHTSTPIKVPSHSPITTQAGRPSRLLAHLSVYL